MIEDTNRRAAASGRRCMPGNLRYLGLDVHAKAIALS